MTLSTYHLPVIFPDEAIVLNYKGYQSPPQPSFSVADYLKYPEGQSGRVHEHWGRDAHMKAMEYVANNKQKDKILRGYVPSTITVNRRNSKKPLYRSPEFADSIGRSKLYGGVITTRQGQELLNEKLQQRIQSLNNLDASAWGSPAKDTSAVLPAPSGLETQPLDDAFVQLSDIIQTGYVSPSMIDSLQKANTALIQIGPYLYPDQIAEYIRINDSLELSVEGMRNSANVFARGSLEGLDERESQVILKSVIQGLKRQRKILEELNKKAFYSVADKKLLLSHVRSQLLPAEVASIRATPSSSVLGKVEQAKLPPPSRKTESSELQRLRAVKPIAERYLKAIRSPPKAESRDI